MPDPDATQAAASVSANNIAWLAREFIDRTNLRTQQIMVAIALAESGGNYKAHNPRPPDDSYGLWQINMYGSLAAARRVQFGIKKNSDLFNPYANARAANAILATQGFGAWSTYTDGKYQKYMDTAWEAINNPRKPTLNPAVIVDLGDAADKVDEELGDELGGILNPADLLGAIVNQILGFVGEAGLRIAGFLGGAALIIIAIVVVVKKGVK